MKRRTINLSAGDDIEWARETGTRAAFAEGVVVEGPGYDRVFVSGLTASEPDLDVGDQTRDVLERIEGDIEAVGGGMDDVVRVRVYVANPHLTRENFRAIHEARGEFFEPESYPASTLVEVSGLIRDGRHVEIDAEAIVPADGWEVEPLDVGGG